MLRFLSVSRLAVIEALEVEFAPGLNVLTGETGAGKSILVQAIDLLVGGRASADLVRTGADAAQVQAVFETAAGREIVVRREVSASGRSRAFVDGELVTSTALRDLTGPLVDLHGQHEHQALLDAERQLVVLDAFASLEPQRSAVAAAFATLADARSTLATCQLDDRERAARLDLATFQLAEIDKAHPEAGEDTRLDAERHVLANVDRLLRLATDAYVLLYEGDTAVIPNLSHVGRRLTDLAALDPRFEAYLARRDAVRVELEDLAEFIQRYLGTLDASPDRLQAVEDRLATLERLKRRHGPTLDEVLTTQTRLRAEIQALTTTAARKADCEQALVAASTAYLAIADDLSRARRAAAKEFGRQLATELEALALGRVRCEFRFTSVRDQEVRWTPHGIDAGELYFAPNVGEEPRPLARIASGGELSRVMLGIKTLVTTDAPGKTLVFDEIDAGIGGRIADVVGARLRRLGRNMQVLCITHLPQVAAHGDLQFRVSKTVHGQRTVTSIERLSAEERVEELARMLGGREVTAQVRSSAREMLQSRRADETEAKGESERAKAKARSKVH